MACDRFLILVLGAVVALLAVFVCMCAIAVRARHVPSRPLHMRLNPFNILADQSLWTPEIRQLNRAAVLFGLAFLACAATAALWAVLNT